jgi:branched-chain amino acid transport system substrate-binding protein
MSAIGQRFIGFALIALGMSSLSWAQETIPIGVLTSQSPPGSVTQGVQVLDGLEIARDILNEQGGVLGRQIELLTEDTSGLPERGRSGIEKLITQDNVVAVTGEHQSSVCLAEIEVAHRYEVPFVNVNCWSDAVRTAGYPEVFNPSPWNSLVSQAMAEVISEMGVDRVVAFAENTDYGIGQAEVLQEKLAELAPNVEYRFQVLDRTASDYTASLLPLRRNPPDMVVTIMLPPAGYQLLSQLHEQGIAPSADTWLFDGAGIADYPDFWENVSDAAKSLIALGFYHPEMKLSELGNRVADMYRERTGEAPGRLPLQATDALFVLADAIERAGSTERQAVIEALKETNFEGTRGTIEFSMEEGPTFQQWTSIPYVVYQYTDVNQDVADTQLLAGPGVEFDPNDLERP